MSEAIKPCSVEGCTEPRVTKKSVCREHRNEKMRAYRAANPENVRAANVLYFLKNEGKTYSEPNGYVKYVGFDHPACNAGGLTPYHRLIMWDKLSGKNTPCAECGEMVYWDVPSNDVNYLCVDHINEVKSDNRPENLDPVHSGCNSKRASRNKAIRKAEATGDDQ